jgi:FkbM family methyltransferase
MNIVQVGCHLGSDHVYDYLSKNSYNLAILIDANPYAIDVCKKQYEGLKNIVFLNYAIVPNIVEPNIKFFIPKNDLTSAHCSTSLDFIQKHNHSQWIEQNIPCSTLTNIFQEYRLKTIDKLYIDAEGLDTQIILALDLVSIDIKYIYFEHIHADGAFNRSHNLLNTINKLQQYGYTQTEQDLYNLGFRKI